MFTLAKGHNIIVTSEWVMHPQVLRCSTLIRTKNRPYPSLFTFHPMASLILIRALFLAGLKITLLLSLRTARNKFVQENMRI